MRLDHKIIYDIIESNSRVLDLGCGSGDLLQQLVEGKNVRTQGIELSEQAIYECVEKGLSVFHSDIDSGLRGYPDKCMDYVILNQSMQETKNVVFVIQEALRVGRYAIVGFPNFAYLPGRIRLFFSGKVPITKSLPYRWYNTPNLHFLSLTDFIDFCDDNKIAILQKHYLGRNHEVKLLPNLFALNGIFVISANR
jgi:methionine biosynthesis protein MetW